MKKTIRYFVEFWYPGSFVAESSTSETKIIDPHKIEWPKNAYSFVLYKREDIIDNNKTYKGELEQLGPTYYHPDSIVETLDQVKQNHPKEKILISNMECNKWDSIVWSRWGNWPQPFDTKKTEVL